jgi:hypothetical protein
MPCVILEPPAIYQTMPSTVRRHVVEVPLAEVDERCRRFGVRERGELYGCTLCLTLTRPHDCIVVLPKVGRGGVGRACREAVERHEHAHEEGWPASHPRQ